MSTLFPFVAFEGELTGDVEFTPEQQEKLNSILAKEKRKTKEAQEQLLVQLEEAKKVAKLGTDERTALENKIEELQKVTMSAEERARQKEAKLKKQYDEELENTKAESTVWKQRHDDVVISNSILQAATENKAIDPVQLLDMMKHKVKLVEKLDDEGKPSGDFVARLSFNDTDKDDKPIVLDLTVNEAVKRMTELPRYGNLFEGGKKSGLGEMNTKGRTKKVDIAKLAKEDPEAFRKLRKEHPELLYG